ncbi:MAG: PH domain-containing protein [Myxococcales bacterium]|nr:PH domain-containing protein [Myxococcales bacterium]
MTAPNETYIFKASDKGFFRTQFSPAGELIVARIVSVLPIVSSEALQSGGVSWPAVTLATIRGCRLTRSRLFDDLRLTISSVEASGPRETVIESRAADLSFHSFVAELRQRLTAPIRLEDEVYRDDFADRQRARWYGTGAGNAEHVTKRSVILVRWWFLFAFSLALPPLAVAMWCYCWWLTLRRFRLVTDDKGLVARYRFRNRRCRWDEIERVTVTEVAVVGSRYLYLEVITPEERLPLPMSGLDGTALIAELTARGVATSPALEIGAATSYRSCSERHAFSSASAA